MDNGNNYNKTPNSNSFSKYVNRVVALQSGSKERMY